MLRRAVYVIVALVLFCLMAGPAFSEVRINKKQTVYVSAYPHVFMGPRGTTFDLAVTLVIRNTNLKAPISVTTVDYYDTQGTLTKKYLASPLRLKPMASTHILIAENDASGGIGSNFIVRWEADREVNAPVIEAVMIGGRSGQGISFISAGQEISE